MGAKRLLNGVKQTYIRTLQLIERIGPEGRFFDNQDLRNNLLILNPKIFKESFQCIIECEFILIMSLAYSQGILAG